MTATAGAAEVSSTPTRLNGDFSIYFHVPFCKRKCDYCHFYVIPDQERFKTLYLQALRQEWELRAHLLPIKKPLSIYFGGGTPSLLNPKAIENILSWIEPSKACEITLEVNPEQVTWELMHTFHRIGINRISLGVQSLHDPSLITLTRTHSKTKALSAIEETRRAGFHNISIDLMYDLPGQTLQQWRATLRQAVQLPITHLSLYNLTIEPHTPFYKKRSLLKTPSANTSLHMLNEAIETFQKAGLHQYEISAFARGQYISQHNTGYWTGRPFLGFGPSAFSYWQGHRFRNVANLQRYAKALSSGNDPIDFQENLSPDDQQKELLAIALRRLEGVAIQQWTEPLRSTIDKLVLEGLLVYTASSLRLTSKGLLFHDTVAEEIINC